MNWQLNEGQQQTDQTSGDYDDELYLATDQQILYRWDETATDWIVEGVGSESDPLPKVWANEIDVNALEADVINTAPTGAVLTLDQDQTIAADTITSIEWSSEDTKGEVSSVLDNGSISIPSGYSFAKFSVRVRFSGSREPDVLRFQKNGENFDGSAYTSGEGLGFETRIPPTLETPFVSVSENDGIDAEIRVPTEVDIQESERITHCEVILL